MQEDKFRGPPSCKSSVFSRSGQNRSPLVMIVITTPKNDFYGMRRNDLIVEKYVSTCVYEFVIHGGPKDKQVGTMGATLTIISSIYYIHCNVLKTHLS